MQKFKFKLFKLSFDNLQRNPLNEHIGSEHGAHAIVLFGRWLCTYGRNGRRTQGNGKTALLKKSPKEKQQQEKTQEIVFQSEKNDEEQGKSSSV
jgi:hypothetical protein